MTREEVTTKILALTPFPPADLEGFLSCDDAGRLLLIQTYATTGVMTASSWQVFVSILSMCEAFVNLVIPISAAVQSVLGVVITVKSL